MLFRSGGINFRPPGPLAVNVSVRRQWSIDDRQYLLGQTVLNQNYYVLGRINRHEASITFRGDIAMSSRLSLQLYAQPFASGRAFDRIRLVSNARGGSYQSQFDLLGPDRLTRSADDSVRIDLDRDGTTDLSFLEPNRRVVSLRTNAVLRWEFRPGSTLYLVWQQRREDVAPVGDLDLSRDWSALVHHAPDNVLALKATWWVGV